MVLSTKDGSASSCCFRSRPPLRLKSMFLRLLCFVLLITLNNIELIPTRKSTPILMLTPE
ncbi:hypothetical protein Hanom_Chr14g01282191 [Helianthus anomalus]